jgi:hypothetical protein
VVSVRDEEVLTLDEGGGHRRKLSAQKVRKQCLEDRVAGRELVFRYAQISRPLQLADVLIDRLLRFVDCVFTDPINLTDARASAGIHFVKCKIRSIEADRLSVQGDLVLDRVHSDGPISLCGARLIGHLRCTGSEFLQPSGTAFNGRGMMVGGSALFDGGFRTVGEFIMASARIEGSVDLTGATLANGVGAALTADGIRVGAGLLLSADSNAAFNAEGLVRLSEAHVSGPVKCSGGQFRAPSCRDIAMDARLIEAEDVSFDEGFKAIGEVSLDGSAVKGRVNCDGGKFYNPGRVALRANGVNCGELYLGRGFAVIGEVQLVGARISRELNCSKGKFCNEKAIALLADGMICDGKIYFDDAFEARGRVQLRNARIRTELNCTKGTFTTLEMGGMTCDGNVYLNDGFSAADRAELMDATVGRELNCKQGNFQEFDARRLTVSGKFDWRPSHAPEMVNVSFASVGLLVDDPDSSWPGDGAQTDPKTKLVGFTFQDLEDEPQGAGKKEDCAKRRTDWLRKASYAPGVYQQLTRVYQRKGQDRDAKEIAIAGQRDRRKRGGMPSAAKTWNWFLDKVVLYGYGMHRPLVVVLFAWLAGTVFFYLAQMYGFMEAVNQAQGVKVSANKCTPSYPCFFPYAYALEIFLPVINLRQINFWLPDAATGWGKALLIWVWIAIASGWVITVAVAAGIGHLFTQRD